MEIDWEGERDEKSRRHATSGASCSFYSPFPIYHVRTMQTARGGCLEARETGIHPIGINGGTDRSYSAACRRTVSGVIPDSY